MKKFSPAWGKSFRGRNRPLRVGATLGEATEPSGASAEGLGGGGGAKVRARGYGVFAEGSPRRSLRPPYFGDRPHDSQ